MGAYDATLTPFFNVVAGYEEAASFYDAFAYFLLFIALLCVLYTIAALRIIICLVVILLYFSVTFPCLTASYFYAGVGKLGPSTTCRIVGTAFVFAASMVAWYLASRRPFDGSLSVA